MVTTYERMGVLASSAATSSSEGPVRSAGGSSAVRSFSFREMLVEIHRLREQGMTIGHTVHSKSGVQKHDKGIIWQ